MNETMFKDLQELASLGYQMRMLIDSLELMGVPAFLIDAIVEGTTGYTKEREQ